VGSWTGFENLARFEAKYGNVAGADHDRFTGSDDGNTVSGSTSMDALSEVLRAIQLTGGLFLHAEFTEPWCVASARILPRACAPYLHDACDVIPYHYVLEGVLRVKLDGGEMHELGAGELVLFPHNHPHMLGSDLRHPAVNSKDLIERPTADDLAIIRHGGGGARTRVVCGFLGGDDVGRNPFVRSLPPALRVDMRATAAENWVQSSFEYAASEVASGRIGSETVLAKLSELLFVQAVRRYAESLPEGQTGWIAGLRDPFVARALALLHRRPGERWSVDALSREVGLSRSALADRFLHVIGMPPMHYLASWRMQLARRELQRGARSIAEIAAMLGYDSEAAFARAFKRVVGRSPGSLRARGGPPP
jgi:AraC-like DNA-binding protein